jgi:hypothetical protein
VDQLPPTITALTPATLSLPAGKAGTLTVTIAPTQPQAAVVSLASGSGAVEVPPSVTIPAGAPSAESSLIARTEGGVTVTAGPLNETTQTAEITVTPAELVTLTITPPGLHHRPGPDPRLHRDRRLHGLHDSRSHDGRHLDLQ